MKITIHFDGTDADDRYDFTLIVGAFKQRGGQMSKVDERGQPAMKLSKADRRSDATIKRALDAVSEPVLTYRDNRGEMHEYKAPEAGEPDVRPRQLKAEPKLELVLEQPDFQRLVDYFDSDAMVWLAEVVDRAQEVSERLSAAMASAKKDDK